MGVVLSTKWPGEVGRLGSSQLISSSGEPSEAPLTWREKL